MRSFTTYAVIASSALLLAACSSVKLEDKPAVVEKPVAKDTRTVEPVVTKSVDPLNDPNSPL
ncbi:MAG: hypothetical protein K0S28_2515, partial [Paucimonas sp.]|nr:hypothetical protein [Paucimonas sp.]